MSSRQRVMRAIRHEPVDRMPIDLGVHFSTGISAVAYWNLREHLGLDTVDIEMIDCVQGLARVQQDILERFHVDTLLLNPPWPNPYPWAMRGKYRFLVPNTFRPARQPDGGWRVEYNKQQMYMPANGYFFDGAWPDFYALGEDERLDLFACRAKWIEDETDKFTLMTGFGGYFHGLEFACDMLTDPEACEGLNERELKRNIEYFDKVNQKFGTSIGAIELNSDLGMQDTAMVSPVSYEQFCYPYLKRFCNHVHQNSDIKIFLHSCGSFFLLLPHIVDAGVDILNPVQISAKGMEPARLKEDYGEELCFWGGGCNTQTVLWSGTPQEVRKNVQSLVEVFKPGGGFVFNQVHNIMGDVPPENIVALLDAAYENAW